MGITTELIQQLNRGFVSERAKKKAEQEKRKKILQTQNDYKNFLYKKFYAHFYANKKNNPENIFAKFQDVDEMRKIINNNNYTILEIFYRIDTYNSILKKVYNQFKNDFKLNYSYENIEKEAEKQQKELENLNIKYIKAIEKRDKAKKRYFEALENYEKELAKNRKVKKQGCLKILAGLFIGGRIASKRYKKMKY